MHRMVAGILSLSQHLSAVQSTPDLYRPACCPSCGQGRVWHHGHYVRKSDRSAAPEQARCLVPILRFRCAGCGRTCSRLPGFLSPRRWYAWAVQQVALLCVLLGSSLRQGAARSGVARSTVRRWRDSLRERSTVFAFHLCSRFPDLGRTVDSTAFWQSCLSTWSLAETMTWLDREVDVP